MIPGGSPWPIRTGILARGRNGNARSPQCEDRTTQGELKLDQSFSAVGSCYDNAAVESFFATVKRELAWIHQRTTWTTRAALRSALFDYIEGFYNPERIQQRLDNRSPIDFQIERTKQGKVVMTAR